eukprot:69437-Prorocentrum_minimum.AAC.1
MARVTTVVCIETLGAQSQWCSGAVGHSARRGAVAQWRRGARSQWHRESQQRGQTWRRSSRSLS